MMMREYTRTINGYPVRQQFSDEDARELGLTGVPKAPVEAEPVEVKDVEPETKEQKPRGRGRQLKRD